MNKRGNLDVTWVFKIMFVIAVISFFATLLANNVIERQVKTDNLELEILAKRIIYSESCFAYKNELSGSVEVGTLNFNSISEDVLSNCFKGDRKIGIRVWFEGKDFYLDEKYYEDTEPIANFDGDYLKYANSFLVKVMKDNEIYGVKPISIIVVGEK